MLLILVKDETMAKPTRARSSRKAPAVKDDDADPQVALEKQSRASRSAFNSWETAQGRTDQQLYDAIGTTPSAGCPSSPPRWATTTEALNGVRGREGRAYD
jgi:hypothetical protein